MEGCNSTESSMRTLRERLQSGQAVTTLSCNVGNVSLKIPTIPGIGRTALKDMPPSNKHQEGQRGLRCTTKGKGRPKKKARHTSPKYYGRNYNHLMKPSRASYRLHLKTRSPQEKPKRINNTSISRTVELIKPPFECGNISTKLLFLASLDLCPKPGVIIAPRVLVTRADPVLVEKIKVRQEKERKELQRHLRKVHQERMARLISIKNRGLLFPPKPIECIDLASDDESCGTNESKTLPRKNNLRSVQKPVNGQLVAHMLQQSNVLVMNHINSKYQNFNLKPTKPVHSQSSQYGIPSQYDEDPEIIIDDSPNTITNSGVISSNSVLNYDLRNKGEDLALEDPLDENPDFILGDLNNDILNSEEYDPPDGNNNLNDSLPISDTSTDDFNPQEFVAAYYGQTEDDIILID